MSATIDDLHAEHLKNLCGGDAALEGLLSTALAKAIAKDPRTGLVLEDGSPRTVVDPAASRTMSHVRDWLAADLAEKAHWLERTDRNGVPVKLAKISSLEQASNEADKAMRRRLSRGFGSKPAVPGEGTEIRMVLADGWSVVRMRTPEALDAESHAMQHCVGQGYYDADLVSGRATFLSLRDPHGTPHATIHLDDRSKLRELSGKQNRRPEQRYLRILRPFLKSGVVMDDEEALGYGLLALDADGNRLDVDDLPETVRIPGDLDLSDCTGRIPRRMEVAGTLTLPTHVPGGVLDAEILARHVAAVDSDIRRFARPFETDGLSLLRLPHFEGLEAGTKVRTDLALADLPKFVEFPIGFGFDGNLVASEVPIGSLPEGTTRLSSLRLHACPIRKLPDGLVVEEGVDVVRCPIEVLQESLVLEGHVSIESAAIRSVETRRIGGSLTIERVAGRPGSADPKAASTLSIAPGIRIGVDLTTTDVDMPGGLPDGLSVGRNLSMKGGTLGPGGKDVSVGKRAYFATKSLESLPDGFSCGGDLMVREGGFRRLGRDTTVAGDLAIDSLEMRSFPENLTIGGEISISIPGVAGIGSGFSVGVFDRRKLPDCPDYPHGTRIGRLPRDKWYFGELPAGLRVEGDLDLSLYPPDRIPEDLVVSGTLLLPEEAPAPGM